MSVIGKKPTGHFKYKERMAANLFSFSADAEFFVPVNEKNVPVNDDWNNFWEDSEASRLYHFPPLVRNVVLNQFGKMRTFSSSVNVI